MVGHGSIHKQMELGKKGTWPLMEYNTDRRPERRWTTDMGEGAKGEAGSSQGRATREKPNRIVDSTCMATHHKTPLRRQKLAEGLLPLPGRPVPSSSERAE